MSQYDSDLKYSTHLGCVERFDGVWLLAFARAMSRFVLDL